MRPPVAVVMLALAAALVPAAASSDPGQATADAVSRVDRSPFGTTIGVKKTHQHEADLPEVWTWESDDRNVPSRYAITIVQGRSQEERFELSTNRAGWRMGLRDNEDFRATVSSAAFADYSAARTVATVRSDALELTQTFLRGARWSYDYAVSDPQRGTRDYSVAIFASSDLPRRIAAAKACAKTGECGE